MSFNPPTPLGLVRGVIALLGLVGWMVVGGSGSRKLLRLLELGGLVRIGRGLGPPPLGQR